MCSLFAIFLRKGGGESEEIQASKIIIVPIQYRVYLKFNDTLF